ncbi:T9SS type A sorting domain-containing protein [Flavobacterium sp.]|uniref:T9SS type A sorting domain-containing protein n=1 Tax=Flavobacterium sp. TaxID=239 RepID=UPI003C5BC5E6
MKKHLLKKAITLLIVISLSSIQLSAQITGNKETFSGSLNGWATGFGTSIVSYANPAESGTTDGALKMVRGDNNANFGFKLAGSTPIGVNATTHKFIKLRYKNGTKANSFRIGGLNGAGNAIKDNTNSDINLNVLTADPGVNTNGYVTTYIDMSSYTLWTGDLQYLWIGVRQAYVASPVEGDFYVDSIEFLTSMPATNTYSEFIINPSFDDISSTLPFNTNAQGTFASRSLSSEAAHDGQNSLKYTYTADADANFWAFSNYSKTYGTMQLAGTTIQVKMWVKTNRHLTQPVGEIPTTVGCRVKLENTVAVTTEQPIVTLTTTNLMGDWEELTFDLTAPANFDKATLWFNLGYDATPGVTTNLKTGNVVYFDQMTATVTAPALAVKQNTLEGVSIYPNPTTDVLNITAPEGSLVEIYNTLGAIVKTAKETNLVSVSDLASGLYLVKISKDGQLYQDKIIKK